MILDDVFAALYDTVMGSAEAGGLGDLRAELFRSLDGDVLEIGAGTGASLPHYPAAARVTLLEPSAPMRQRLAPRAGDRPVVSGAAEALPFEDARFDAVVATLVLCSVRDVPGSLAEIRRVLRPGGRFVFIEHVRSPRPFVRGVQHAIEPVWKICGRGCHLTRDTEAALEAAGFTFEQLDRSDLPVGNPLVSPAIHGIARAAP